MTTYPAMAGQPLAPFPYFGGKRRAAPIVWRALGDPSGYVEPFAGSKQSTTLTGGLSTCGGRYSPAPMRWPGTPSAP